MAPISLILKIGKIQNIRTVGNFHSEYLMSALLRWPHCDVIYEY